tara:strand:- start:6445 stop:6639 length:195 start_codon:yes stop_codon:yes gene_type:complete
MGYKMNVKTNKEIKKIDFEIYRRENIIYHISLKESKTDQDKKDIKTFKKSINQLNKLKRGFNNE